MVNSTPPSAWSGAASAYPNQSREQISAYAYPDFCATVDGGTTDNTTCLMSALTATGLYFGTLELPALSPCTGCTQSQTNYYCTSLGTTWPNPTARVHIWKGATVSCAFPPADTTHIIQDDNQAPIVPWSTATFPSTNGGAVYTCPTCLASDNDMTAVGTYTGTQAGNYCVQIQSGASNMINWNFNAASNEQLPAMSCTGFTGGPITMGGTITLNNGISVKFTGTSHTYPESWSIAVTPAGTNPGNPVSVTVPATADVLCSVGSDTTISGVTCVNTGNNTTPLSFQTMFTVPANAWAPGRAFRISAQFAIWTSSSPPSIKHTGLSTTPAVLTNATGPFPPPAGLMGSGFSAGWLVIAAGTGGSYVAQPLYNNLPGGTATITASIVAQPVVVGTASFQFAVASFYTTPATAGNAIQLQSLVVERIN